MLRFEEIIQPREEDKILDVGGYPITWLPYRQRVSRIDCINIHEINWDAREAPNHRITVAVGDGCALNFIDASYEILFSNSVIEHVGNWEKQCQFAKETCRVGKKLWIQTPALACPIEPHYLAPFVHWLPIGIRRRILRWGTPWGWITKPSQKTIDRTIAFTQLLSKKQLKKLYPDCKIYTERFLGIFPKSYVVYRVECA